MSILIKLKEMRKNSSKIDEKIIDYILKDTVQIRMINTYELAKNAGVSQASIVRFAKKMGFSGFPEFKIFLVEALQNVIKNEKVILVDDEIKSEDATKEIGEKLFLKNCASLKDTLILMEGDEVERAVAALSQAEKILIIGSGSSAIVGKYFQAKLLELGIDAIFEFDQHIQMLHISRMGSRDAAFIISQSGKTLDTYTTANKIKNKGAKIISLTNVAPNPIKQISDIALWIATESNAMSSTFTHRIAQLSLLELLYVKLMLENRELAEKQMDTAFEMTEDMKI